MLEYSEKLTLRPWDMVEQDVVALREAGFSDSAILDINQVTGYYAFANRLADGLGIELDFDYIAKHPRHLVPIGSNFHSDGSVADV